MKAQARGSFDVQSTPHPPLPLGETLTVGHMTFRKTFQGDLVATSVVEMLGLMFKDVGSGGYVALESVTGTLGGRKGVFCLQHSSTMTRGRPAQSVTVVPDSGTGDLAGLSGAMVIDVVDGKHLYTFDYALADDA